MRGCTRCGATYATEVSFCPRDGAATVAVPDGFVSPVGKTATPRSVSSVTGRPVDPFLGKMVGSYRLARRLGAGGMGAVYEGVHPEAGFRVAVKLLGGQSALDRELVERFFVEARTLNQLAHENIVRAIDLGQHPEGFYYCVMELLEGETLAALLARGRPTLGRSLELLAQACDALAAAHENGVVHRDLKPANVMIVRHPVTGADLVKLVDFGIAKLQSTHQNVAATVSGTVIGTPAYMSPEQAAGRVEEIDPRSDLYALGVLAYELVTGQHPFAGMPVGELLVAQVVQAPKLPSTIAPLPERLEQAILRAMQKRREDRFDSAGTFALELRAIAQEWLHPPPAVEVPEEIPLSEPLPPPPRERTKQMSATPRVRLAQRQAPTPVRPAVVRPLFVLAFALSGVIFGAAVTGLLDAEPVVASLAEALGLAPEPAQARLAVPAAFDGVNPAFVAGGAALSACRPGFEAMREWRVPGALAALEPALKERRQQWLAFDECVSKAGLSSPARWSGDYLTAVAALEFAVALDGLPTAWLQAAHQYKADGLAPFRVELYAGLATDRFQSASEGAPIAQRPFIERFEIDLDVLRQRAAASR